MNHGLIAHSLLTAALIGLGSFPKARAEKPASSQIIAPSLQKFIDDKTISGAVTLVASPDQILSLEAIGLANIEAKTPMKTNAMFWIASMTKPMTGVALMMLAEEGKLSIEDPVEKYLPEFKGQMLAVEKDKEHVLLKKPSRPISIKDLLTHTSGLVSKSPLDGAALDVLSLKEAVMTYALSPLQFEPGSKWSYCNPGINTLGRLIEVISGIPYAEFMQQRLFDPLGMKETTFWPDDALLQRLAKSYKQTADKTALEETTVTYLTHPLNDRKRMPLAAGGLFSCASDLVKFYQMVLHEGKANGKQLIKAETLKQMETNQTGDLKVSFADGMNMGLGFHIVKDPQGVTESLNPGSFGHGGAYGAQAWMDPNKKLIIVLLIQRAGLPNSDQSEVRRELQKAAVSVFGRK
jgi:CubicO group peptidase (beta-lactamase class C family)